MRRKALTLKEKKLVEYIKSGDLAYIAFRKAYDSSCNDKAAHEQVSRILKRPLVKEALDNINAEAIDKLAINEASVLADLEKVFDIATGNKPIMQSKFLNDGSVVHEKIYVKDLATAKGIKELFGKHLKMWDDKTDININVTQLETRLRNAKKRLS